MARKPAKKPKTEKKPRAPKETPVKAAAAAKPAPSVKFNSAMDVENQKLFVNIHLPAIIKQRDLVDRNVSDLRKLYKTAKAEGGFTKADFDTAIQLEDAEREAKTKARIARQLVIAKYMGKGLGAQLDMFLEPDRTPSSDIAYEEGRQAHIENKPAKPGYDPSTEQHRRYMEGYHSVTEERVKGGIKKLDPEIEADEQAKAQAALKTAKQKSEDEKAFDTKVEDAPPVTSGVPTTRAAFIAQQQREQAAAAAAGDGEGEDSAFSKRSTH